HDRSLRHVYPHEAPAELFGPSPAPRPRNPVQRVPCRRDRPDAKPGYDVHPMAHGATGILRHAQRVGVGVSTPSSIPQTTSCSSVLHERGDLHKLDGRAYTVETGYAPEKLIGEERLGCVLGLPNVKVRGLTLFGIERERFGAQSWHSLKPCAC